MIKLSSESYAYLGFLWLVLIVLEISLQIINYKGRFKYGMYEQISVWRWFDKQRRIIAYLYFPISFFFTVVVAPLALAIMGTVASEIVAKPLGLLIPFELILSSILGILIGTLFLNVKMDRLSVRSFETCYRTCQHNRECATFRSRQCLIPNAQRNSRALLSLLEGENEA